MEPSPVPAPDPKWAVVPAATRRRLMVPVTIGGEQVALGVILYTPAGGGPFPTLIFHHGSTGFLNDPFLVAHPFDPTALVGWFTARGWAVALPSRRGRGGSQGLYDEGVLRNGTPGYSAEPKVTLAGAERALADIDALTPVLLDMPFVDRTRFAVGGQSRGGILSLAWSARRPTLPRAVVNFVGGWLGGGSPTGAAVNQSLMTPHAADAPASLWLYGDQDPYYPLASSRANFAAFKAAGGRGTFHDFQPPAGLTGHEIVWEPALWSATLEAYLGERGLPARAA
ncbi:MAG: alpha/beta hydrolase family protein [Reyranellales bacterium]